MFRRNSILVKEVIMKNLREQGLETPLLQKRLIDAWPVVMGEAIAALTGDLYIRNQTLFVHLNNPALRMELSMQRQDVVRRLNEHVGNQVIADIRFN
jgi:predicted nucleic acid-binding Zn ribbon protein